MQILKTEMFKVCKNFSVNYHKKVTSTQICPSSVFYKTGSTAYLGWKDSNIIFIEVKDLRQERKLKKFNQEMGT